MAQVASKVTRLIGSSRLNCRRRSYATGLQLTPIGLASVGGLGGGDVI